MIKDLEFIFKKIFFSESYLLKRRLIRAIKKNYEKELKIIQVIVYDQDLHQLQQKQEPTKGV